MTWEALAAIAQLAAVVDVVPSLIYPAAQIREQNKERRRGALGVATRGWATIFKTLTDSSEFADIYLRGVQQFDDLSLAERVRFSAFVGTVLSNIEELYYYHKDGTLDAPHWGEVARTMTDIVAYLGTQAWWSARRHWYTDEFAALIDQIISEKREANAFDLFLKTPSSAK
jgi:hypothetical protein